MIMREDEKSAQDFPALADRRGAERYPCNLAATWRALEADGCDAERFGDADVCDISTTGIGLVMASAVRSGEILAVQLQCCNKRLARPMPVRAMYALAREYGEWRVGACFLRPLTQLELRAILDES
jgi:hypothetical protein